MAEKRFAILIASNSYPAEPGLKDLRCPENDVGALDAVLRSPDFGSFTETFVFKNRPNHEVLEKIETVLAEAGRNDLVLIYFSGHGKLNPAGQLCLATANTKLRALGSTSIQAAEIKSYFDHSCSRKKILLLDCCYSGAVGKAFARGGVDDQLQLMSRGQGTFIMTASTGIEVAVEKEGDEYGLFTKHLVQGIRSGEADKDEDGLVGMHELYEYVHTKVREEGAQEPMKWNFHAKGELILSRSGRDGKEEQQQKIRVKLYGLAAQGLLTDGIVHQAVKLLSMPDKKKKNKDRQCSLLIEELNDDRISSADFVERWTMTCVIHPDINDKRKKQIVAQQQWKKQAVSKCIEFIAIVIASLGMYVSINSILPFLFSKRDNTPVVVDHLKIKQVVADIKETTSIPEVGASSVSQQDKTMTDSTTSMEFASIPKGCFQMGSSSGEKGRDGDEGPVHEVCVDGFWMGKYEVTQGQWKKVMRDNPANFQKGDNYPVEQVSWEDAQKFIAKLNKKSKKEYRLPTEAEWEYAARASTKTSRHWGDDISCDKAMYGNSKDWDNSCSDYIRKRGLTSDSTAPVGSYSENQFGLYDMLGNVWEWCADWYDEKYYTSSPKKNPTGPDSGALRVLRGGSWFAPPVYCRSVDRRHDGSRFRGYYFGFRLVLPF